MLKDTIIKAMKIYFSNPSDSKVQATLEIWHELMDDAGIEHELADKAFKQAMLENDFMPKPKDVLELVNGSKENNALAAWIDLLQAHSEPNSVYRSIAFADKQIHAVIKVLGGWTRLYDRINHLKYKGDELTWVKKEFIDTYKACRTNVDYKMLQARPTEVKRKPILIGDTSAVTRLLSTSTSSKASEIIKQIASNN